MKDEQKDEKTYGVSPKDLRPETEPEPEPEKVEGLSRDGLMKLMGLVGVIVVGTFLFQNWATSQAGEIEKQPEKKVVVSKPQANPEQRKKSMGRQLDAQAEQRRIDAQKKESLKNLEAQAIASAPDPTDPGQGTPSSRANGAQGGARQGGTNNGQNGPPSPWEQARKQYQAQMAKQFYDRRVTGSLDVIVFEKVSARDEERPGARNQRSGSPSSGPSPQDFRQAQALASQYGVEQAQPGPSGGRGAPSLEDRQEDYFAKDFKASSIQTRRPPGAKVVPAGTVVHVRLVTGIQTDLPGHILGEILRDVWDETSTHVVLASGTKVFGQYNTRLEWGQDRTQIRWTHARLLDGRTLGLPRAHGVDLAGMAGVTGSVDNHLGEVFLGGALSALSQGATGAAAGPQSALNVNPGQAALTGAGRGASNVGDKLSEKYLGMEPTLTIEPGRVLGMYLDSDLVIPRPIR